MDKETINVSNEVCKTTACRYSVRDNVSGEYVIGYTGDCILLGDKEDRMIFTNYDDAYNQYSIIKHVDDTLPEIVDESK